MSIKAVLFDMDGLMFDTESLATKGIGKELVRQGFSDDEETLFGTLGIDFDTCRAFLVSRFGEGVDFPKIVRSMDEYIDFYIDAHGTPVKDGLIELLDALDARRVPYAIASSSPMSRIARNFQRSPVDISRFAAVASGDMVKRGKPEPDIFLLAANMLGVKAEECIVCEDSKNGVEAAKRAGAMAVMVPDLRPPDGHDKRGLYALVPSLRDVIALIPNTK